MYSLFFLFFPIYSLSTRDLKSQIYVKSKCSHTCQGTNKFFLCQKFIASLWTAEQSSEIKRLAEEGVAASGGVRIVVVPYGLHVEKGQDGVVEFLVGRLGEILNG